MNEDKKDNNEFIVKEENGSDAKFKQTAGIGLSSVQDCMFVFQCDSHNYFRQS